MTQYFPKPYRNLGGNAKVKVDVSSHATKSDIENISHVDTSSLLWKQIELKGEVGYWQIRTCSCWFK